MVTRLLCGFPSPPTHEPGGLSEGQPWCGPSCGLAPDSALSPQAHNDLLRTYEAKLQAFGVPLDNVGFQPLETAVMGQNLGQGPAGLVATPT